MTHINYNELSGEELEELAEAGDVVADRVLAALIDTVNEDKLARPAQYQPLLSERTAQADTFKALADTANALGAMVVQFKATQDFGGGYGLLLARVPASVQPYVVWRWATTDTDGQPVNSRSGAMFWSGNYFNTYEEAVIDFDSRSATR